MRWGDIGGRAQPAQRLNLMRGRRFSALLIVAGNKDFSRSISRACSLVRDVQEPYQYLVDDFVIQFLLDLRKKNFTVKAGSVSQKRKGKREYLNDAETRRMMKELNEYFESNVEILRNRQGNGEVRDTDQQGVFSAGEASTR